MKEEQVNTKMTIRIEIIKSQNIEKFTQKLQSFLNEKSKAKLLSWNEVGGKKDAVFTYGRGFLAIGQYEEE